ncbi:hypothetical protein MCOR27_000824 [Pyricularia oryzae]|uniref:Uncharacterized protein n=5 Tax=Pyricularia TaxID=48558 RepID=A0ABQ8NJ41_PYRGI|nr:uncharacterized protein MGG_07930 [Pyricularia oryzae 70-15]ELQ35712.1 hypothetical protein OOU_Y34scaffold00692g15 [Pyricularia oryzae Y34]KAH8848500.1 hypothetical protein MCOR01_001880 [Pyricularia oryzae]KAI6297923.1 hypothetical protein MCOR33_005824 [Pyricularia grisea]EHA53368.1 hypothetical protein MGG_07930 [Pyricularia oryzae 70-15]KAH9429547.1 hypothetical protein MCOR02_009283 [Pyricularia oryzae]
MVTGKSAGDNLMMDGDQHTHGDPSSTHPEPLQAGEQTSHNVHDPKDQYSLADRANKEKLEEKEAKRQEEKEKDIRPTDIAESHGNKPSRGAQVDEMLEKEDEERLKQKAESKSAKKH